MSGLNMLHIRRAGGTALKEAFRQPASVSYENMFKFYGHGKVLQNEIKTNPDGKVIFGVRDPLKWFVLAFNSSLTDRENA